MKKFISLLIFLIILSISTSVFAAPNISMEIVEDNVCSITLTDNSKLEKKIISSDLEKNQVTIQLELQNNEKDIVPTGELMLVIDSSSSMNTEISEGTTRKDIVLESANSLVESLLELNASTLKIGVVSFSSSTVPTEMGTEKDAQLVSDFTNNLEDLKSKISKIEGTGNYTDLDSGLKLAKSTFSEDETNKYLIILTDGVPNMNVGNSDLVSYDALTTVINTTKETMQSLKDIEVISVLTGIEDNDAVVRTDGTNSYTYGQVIEGVFGTETEPTIGKFYNISDTEIEETIKQSIYSDLVPIPNTLKNITIVDYFPQYIIDNFEMAYVEGTNLDNVSATIDSETNSITWEIAELKSGEKTNIQYTLTLKDDFSEEIIGDILNTNLKVDINYTNPDGSTGTRTSDVTPKIKLNEIPQEEPPKEEEPPQEEPPKDNTVAPQPIPHTGAPIFIGIIGGITIITIVLAKKYKHLDF